MTRLEAKVEREKPVLASSPGLLLTLLELARAQGRTAVAEAGVLTGSNRNTIKAHLRKWVEAGHLKQQGAGRGVWYGLSCLVLSWRRTTHPVDSMEKVLMNLTDLKMLRSARVK